VVLLGLRSAALLQAAAPSSRPAAADPCPLTSTLGCLSRIPTPAARTARTAPG
jgi:hypothetical protein